MRRVVIALGVALAAVGGFLAGGVAQAKPALRATLLPTRRSDGAELTARVTQVGAKLAVTLGADVAPEAAPTDLEARLVRAQELAAAGQIDEAAAMLDAALDAGARAPHRVGQPATFVTAHVTRLSIALARGEKRRASALVSRLFAYDHGFRLDAAEDSPRMRHAIDAGRAQTTALTARQVGEACRDGAGILLAARPTEDGRVEYVRFDDCRPVATTVAAQGVPADEIVRALRHAPGAMAPTPTTTTTTTTTPTPAFYQRAWFWTVVGAVTVSAAGVTAWQLGAFGDGEQSYDVVPRL